MGVPDICQTSGGDMNSVHEVFVTGGTGYIGQRLIPVLLSRGHKVRALVRATSVQRLPEGATPVIGNALDAKSFSSAVRSGDTLVHLVGTPHPSPAKAAEFKSIDLASVNAAVTAARAAGITHFVYVSVAQPAPTMRAYVEVRAAGEQAISQAGLTATVLRPWYVLGPGHWWPLILLPGYLLAELLPSTRATAQRLGLLTMRQMIVALVQAVENPPLPGTLRVVDVPTMRNASKFGLVM